MEKLDWTKPKSTLTGLLPVEKNKIKKIKKKVSDATRDEKGDGEKVVKVHNKDKKAANSKKGAKHNSAVERLYTVIPRKYTSPFESRLTHPFVTGTSKNTFNIGIKMQQFNKKRDFMENRVAPAHAPGVKPLKRSKPFIAHQMRSGYIWTGPKDQEWPKKVKDMFLALHNDYAALIEQQGKLSKAKVTDDEHKKLLAEIEQKLAQKELQVQVAVKLYDENQKLRAEVQWLRSNIRPRGKRPQQKKPKTASEPLSLPYILPQSSTIPQAASKPPDLQLDGRLIVPV